MSKSILTVLIGKRKNTAINIQKVLTGWGCIIKTRLGIHDGVLDNCSDEGLLILELVGKQEENEELARKLKLLNDVHAELIHLSIPTK
jgi:hypothetical protein